MTSLDQFIEPIKVAGKPVDGDHTAYKMDDTTENRDMRIAAGLGTCHCCDYFLPRDDSIVLIEETCLLGSVRDIREEYKYLKKEHLDVHVDKLIRNEMQLKAYGAMLVVCRLAKICAAAKNILRDKKKYEFWLVASITDSSEEKRLFDNLKDSLRNMLRDVLGKELLDNVEVIPSGSLGAQLSGSAHTR
ncbi:MAG: hypothetical protein MPJ81_01670 [Gammaproteobacteria bacterium]|nr:hypothetical protein [Gammaproteobacteria bacterium]